MPEKTSWCVETRQRGFGSGSEPTVSTPLPLAPSRQGKGKPLITCYLRYVIGPHKAAEFERYARMLIPLVNKFRGIHHGCFLRHEGANNIALALFSFPSPAAHEEYRLKMARDPQCLRAMGVLGI
jgi:hypothetical protein